MTATGLFFLPDSPRYFVKRGNIEKAAHALSRVRGQPADSQFVQEELAEIIANHEYELQVVPQGSYFSSWANCFQGSVWKGSSNLRRTILGTSLQMMQQWTGVNFVFYFGTTFFQELGTISNPFLISLITTLVNVCSTPISFWIIERFGRRAIMIWGAVGMVVCQFIVAIVGTADSQNQDAVKAMIAFICIYIFFFATTWGPGAWAPGCGKEENVDADEGDHRLYSILVLAICGTDNSNDELTNNHSNSAPDHDCSAAESLNNPEGNGSRAHVDKGSDERNEEWIG